MAKTSPMVRLTSQICEVIVAADIQKQRVKTVSGVDIPQVFWPDGTVCWLVNLYLLDGLYKGRSRINKGGTLRTWAKHLSLFVKYCYLNRIDLMEVSDSRFTMFVNGLKEEIHPKNPDESKRSTNHLLTICATVLNFVAYLNKRFEGQNLIGENGRVRATQVITQVTTPRGKIVSRSRWTHASLPDGSGGVRRRLPISTSGVEELHEANHRLNTSEYLTRRRYIMLRLLQITGGRRIEIAFIKTKDILNAVEQGELRLFSAKKRRPNVTRVLPIVETNLYDVLSFIKHHRQFVVRKTIGLSNDHDYLFISERSGKPLMPDTLDTELKKIALEAGIENEEVCLHAFRHRFCTLLFRQYIRAKKYDNKKSFIADLLRDKAAMDQILQWTGHASIESLENYIHHAWEVENGAATTNIRLYEATSIVESLEAATEETSRRLQRGNVLNDEDMKVFVEILKVSANALRELNLGFATDKEKSKADNKDEEGF